MGLKSDLKVKKFSLGMKQRLNIAQAVFEKQKIILLDEPTNALDNDGVQLIYKLLKEEKKKRCARGYHNSSQRGFGRNL